MLSVALKDCGTPFDTLPSRNLIMALAVQRYSGRLLLITLDLCLLLGGMFSALASLVLDLLVVVGLGSFLRSTVSIP
jgi:hypothetical protein